MNTTLSLLPPPEQHTNTHDFTCAFGISAPLETLLGAPDEEFVQDHGLFPFSKGTLRLTEQKTGTRLPVPLSCALRQLFTSGYTAGYSQAQLGQLALPKGQGVEFRETRRWARI